MKSPVHLLQLVTRADIYLEGSSRRKANDKFKTLNPMPALLPLHSSATLATLFSQLIVLEITILITAFSELPTIRSAGHLYIETWANTAFRDGALCSMLSRSALVIHQVGLSDVGECCVAKA